MSEPTNPYPGDGPWSDGAHPSVSWPPEMQELAKWWQELAYRDILHTVPKAIEYSAVDLEIMGSALLKLLKWEDPPEGAGVELALAFYELGKISRVIGALAERHLPARDTWDDIRIYAVMAARAREVGGWPN